MAITFWLYVSRSTIPSDDTQTEIQRIVNVSQVRNRDLHITGALVYGDDQFGQFIEGPPEGLLMVRSSILRDARHTAIKTIDDGKADARRFGGWSLAYSQPSVMISRALQRARRASLRNEVGAGEGLIELMKETVLLARP